MADPILVPIEKIDIRVSGVKISEGLPASGTYMTITKASGVTVVTEGLFTTAVHSAMVGKVYTVTLNTLPGSQADLRMAAALDLTRALSSVVAFTYIVGLTTYTSPALSFLDEPTVELASDGAPLRVYTLSGVFLVVKVGGYGAPPVLTEDQILAAIPA